MSGDVNITIIEDVAYVNLTLAPEPLINVTFSDVAIADPAVALARNEAESSAEDAAAAAALAIQKAAEAEAALANITPLVQQEVINALAASTDTITNALIFG